MAPCMRRLSSVMLCVAIAMATLRNAVRSKPLRLDDGGVCLTAQHRLDRALFPDRKHDDRHTIFPGKREGGGVHDFQIAVERLPVSEAVGAGGGLSPLPSGRVDALH